MIKFIDIIIIAHFMTEFDHPIVEECFLIEFNPLIVDSYFIAKFNCIRLDRIIIKRYSSRFDYIVVEDTSWLGLAHRLVMFHD